MLYLFELRITGHSSGFMLYGGSKNKTVGI